MIIRELTFPRTILGIQNGYYKSLSKNGNCNKLKNSLYKKNQRSKGPFWAPKTGTTNAYPRTHVRIKTSICIYKRGLTVCLFACLFGFWAQTTGWIPTKFGMDLPMDPVGNLEIPFRVPPPGGYNFGNTQKIPTFPWPRTEGGIRLRHLFAQFFGFFWKILILFLNVDNGLGRFFRAAKRPAPS